MAEQGYGGILRRQTQLTSMKNIKLWRDISHRLNGTPTVEEEEYLIQIQMRSNKLKTDIHVWKVGYLNVTLDTKILSYYED